MLVYLADRVKETSSTTGTGTFSLNGAVRGFQTFVAGLGDGALTYYAIADGTDWEVGSGVVTDASTDTLSRFVFKSSNSNNLVDFAVGEKEVFSTYPAPKSVYSAFTPPLASGLAFWQNANELGYQESLVWSQDDKRIGISQPTPGYAIDIGGAVNYSLINVSGIRVTGSGVVFGNNTQQTTAWVPMELSQQVDQNLLAASGNENQVIGLDEQGWNLVFAGPTECCASGYPTFRSLVIDDVPDLSSLYTKYAKDAGNHGRVAFFYDNHTLAHENIFVWVSGENRLGLGYENPEHELSVAGSGFFSEDLFVGRALQLRSSGHAITNDAGANNLGMTLKSTQGDKHFKWIGGASAGQGAWTSNVDLAAGHITASGANGIYIGGHDTNKEQGIFVQHSNGHVSILCTPSTDGALTVHGNIVPDTSGYYYLGSPSLPWSGVYLGSMISYDTDLEFKHNDELDKGTSKARLTGDGVFYVDNRYDFSNHLANTYIGPSAGDQHTGAHSIMIGSGAGFSNTQNSSFYVANGSSDGHVLVSGNLDTGEVFVPNGSLHLSAGGLTYADGSVGTTSAGITQNSINNFFDASGISLTALDTMFDASGSYTKPVIDGFFEGSGSYTKRTIDNFFEASGGIAGVTQHHINNFFEASGGVAGVGQSHIDSYFAASGSWTKPVIEGFFEASGGGVTQPVIDGFFDASGSYTKPVIAGFFEASGAAVGATKDYVNRGFYASGITNYHESGSIYIGTPIPSVVGTIGTIPGGTSLNEGRQYNVAVGDQAMVNITHGYYNVAVGYKSQQNVTTEALMTSVGYNALGSSGGGAYCTAVGGNALQHSANPGHSVTAVGVSAGQYSQGDTSSIFLGAYAGRYNRQKKAIYIGNGPTGGDFMSVAVSGKMGGNHISGDGGTELFLPGKLHVGSGTLSYNKNIIMPPSPALVIGYPVGAAGATNPGSDYSAICGYGSTPVVEVGSGTMWLGPKSDGTGSDNLGINTRNPRSRLSVGGNVMIGTEESRRDGQQSYNIELLTDPTCKNLNIRNQNDGYDINFDLHSTSSELHVRAGTGSATTFVTFDAANGSVRMGDSNSVGNDDAPGTYTLEVVGNAAKSVAGSWPGLSDSRIKENIETVSDGLTKVMALRPVGFNYVEEFCHCNKVEERKYYGFIAQEYETLFPESVSSTGKIYGDNVITPAVYDNEGEEIAKEEKEVLYDDLKIADISDVVPYLVAALQELKGELDAAKQRISDLESS